MTVRPGRRRLAGLMAAGLVDSLCLSVAWTVVVLRVTAQHGLAGTGVCSAAMLAGVALSAPTAGWLTRRLSGRQLLRSAAAVEAVLRLSVFGLLLGGAPLWLLAVCVCVMNVVAWTGYAGMRAEVAAVSAGSRALTWYGAIVASVEAVGVAAGSLLPGTQDALSPVLGGVVLVYVLALVPTVLVAGGSPVAAVARARAAHPRALRPRVSMPVVGGSALMFLAAGPTLLAVGLGSELHGRSAVGPAAAAFTLGSLCAPALAAKIQARGANDLLAWVVCGFGMVAGWLLAPLSLLALCFAQLCSGLSMTALEGLLDTSAALRQPDEMTGALARATAGRALGSAAGTALLPCYVASVGLEASLAVLVLVLGGAAVAVRWAGLGRPTRSLPLPAPHAGPLEVTVGTVS